MFITPTDRTDEANVDVTIDGWLGDANGSIVRLTGTVDVTGDACIVFADRNAVWGALEELDRTGHALVHAPSWAIKLVGF